MKIVLLFLLVSLLGLFHIALAANADLWESRAIYQVLTDRFAGTTTPCKDLSKYCGGTWKGIQGKLDYIQGMGFDAIWISPIVHNIKDGYHGYWADDLTKTNEHFGTKQDLKDLVKECHRRGMYVMLDVVGNHMVQQDFSMKDFPKGIVPFNDPAHYHSCSVCPSNCNVMNWQNQNEVENCRLFDMPDLNQTHPFVRKTLNSWIKSTVTDYGFDGVRIDTLCEVPKWFWEEFSRSAGTYCIGEAANVDAAYVGGYQKPTGPVSGVLSFPLFYRLQWVFANKKSMYQLQEVNNLMNRHFGKLKHLGTFLENHDQPRFAHLNPDMLAFKAAMTYTILSVGIPIVYQGTEHHLNGGDTPWNREAMWTSANYNTSEELYKWIGLLVNFRKNQRLWKEDQVERFVKDDFYAFSRGKVLVALTNSGSSGNVIRYTVNYHPYKVGQKLCNLFFSSDCTIVTNQGVEIVLNYGESKVLYPAK